MAMWSLVLGLVALLAAEVNGDPYSYLMEQDVTTSGTSGPMCGRRHCITNATCEKGKCKCPSGTHGDAHIQCVPEGTFQCTITADPHLHTFGGARANVALPCTYIISRMKINMTSLIGYFGVQATNVYHNGKFYVSDVRVFNGLSSYETDKPQPADGFSNKITLLDFTPSTASNGNYNYKTSDNSQGRSDKFGDYMNPTKFPYFYNSSEAVPQYDYDNNLVTVSAGGAGLLQMAFRLYDAAKASQDQLPGIAFQVPASATINDDFGPLADLCGEVTEGPDKWAARALALGLNSPDLAVIHEVLTDNANIMSSNTLEQGPAALQCFDTKSAYKESNAQAELLNACGPLVTDRAMRTCVEQQEVNVTPMEAFNICIVHNSYETCSSSTNINTIADYSSRCDLLDALRNNCGLKCREMYPYCGCV